MLRWFYAHPHHTVDGTSTSAKNLHSTLSGVCVCMCVYSLLQRRQVLQCVCECEAICRRKHRLGTHVDLTVSPGHHTKLIYNIFMHIQMCTYTYIHWTSHAAMAKAVLCTHARTRTLTQHTRRCQRLFCARTLAHLHTCTAHNGRTFLRYTRTHTLHLRAHTHTQIHMTCAPRCTFIYTHTSFWQTQSHDLKSESKAAVPRRRIIGYTYTDSSHVSVCLSAWCMVFVCMCAYM